jgi:dTDP-4-dehydrorhamnose reductase
VGMRVLIVGASGFVGSALQAAFGPDAVGTYCTHAADGLRQLDLRDVAAVQLLVGEARPELIIQPAAQPNVDWCEDHEQESHEINVFFSSDYVFSGAAGPYAEDAATGPQNVYGRHKLEAERLIAARLDDYVIVRVCGVYGFEPRGKNFVMGLLAKGRRGEPMNVPSDQWGTPTYADNLAAVVRELVSSGCHGIYHVVGPECMDRVSFARLACEVFGLDPAFLRVRTTAELRQRAPRPLRGGLQTAKVRAILKTQLLGPRRGLELMRERLRHEGLLS